MNSGRTSPALCGCEDEHGGSVGDYVVKLRGGLDRGKRGLVCELIGSRLAAYFGIATPDPALVVVDAALAELVATAEPKKAVLIRNSIGLNFGSRHIIDSSGWPVDRRIPETMLQAAVNIFAFDALIQNPDRRFSNQNLFTRGDDIIVYDHELSFSFLESILPTQTPWTLDDQPNLHEHVFYRQLRRKPLDLTGFMTALAELANGPLEVILTETPAEWNNEVLGKIEQHLRLISLHADEFREGIIRRLA
jgi:hypothetical protein